MRIGLLSDTHFYIDTAWTEYFASCDEIWHAGDIGNLEVLDHLKSLKPVRAVFGNIDGAALRAELPEDLHFSANGLQVYMTHIGGHPGKYSPHALSEIKLMQPKLFICGHSHILKVAFDKTFQMLTINPGAAGIHGFHKVKTIMRFDISDSQVKNAEVIELGSRGKI